jgi:hypothetical protein
VRALLRAGDAGALGALEGEQPSVVSGVAWSYRLDPEAVVIRATGDVEALRGENALPLEVRLPRSRVVRAGH